MYFCRYSECLWVPSTHGAGVHGAVTSPVVGALHFMPLRMLPPNWKAELNKDKIKGAYSTHPGMSDVKSPVWIRLGQLFSSSHEHLKQTSMVLNRFRVLFGCHATEESGGY